MSTARAATLELTPDDTKQLSALLAACLPGSGANTGEVARIVGELSKTLSATSPNAKARCCLAKV